MAEVDVGGETYVVYRDVEELDLYLGAASHATAWRAADEDTKARAAVTITRLLDRQLWKGEPTVYDQDLAWPRIDTGLEWVDDDVIPEDILDAAAELAAALVAGGAFQDNATTRSRISRVKAGSVEVEMRADAELGPSGVPSRFPLIVDELLAPYLLVNAGTVAPAMLVV